MKKKCPNCGKIEGARGCAFDFILESNAGDIVGGHECSNWTNNNGKSKVVLEQGSNQIILDKKQLETLKNEIELRSHFM